MNIKLLFISICFLYSNQSLGMYSFPSVGFIDSKTNKTMFRTSMSWHDQQICKVDSLIPLDHEHWDYLSKLYNPNIEDNNQYKIALNKYQSYVHTKIQEQSKQNSQAGRTTRAALKKQNEELRTKNKNDAHYKWLAVTGWIGTATFAGFAAYLWYKK